MTEQKVVRSKVAPEGAKPAYLSMTMIASAFGITMLMLGVILKPFDITIPVFTTEQVAAICAVIAQVIVMIRRLQPQSPLYFLKQIVEEIIEVATEVNTDEPDSVAPSEQTTVETKQGEQDV